MRSFGGSVGGAIGVTLVGLALGGCGDAGGGGEAESAGEASTGAATAATSASTGAVAPTTGDTEGQAAAVTWHQDIAPVVVGKCGGCHVAGGIAPFSLQSHAEAATFAAAMLDAVERKTMPPFLADSTDECEPRFGFADDPRLTDDELEDLRAWVAAGAPEGDAKTAAPVPAPPDLTLKDADIHLKIPGEVVVSGAQDQYVCFSIDPGFTTDTWLDGLQITAGNPKIVHHVLAYVDADGASAELAGPDGSYPCFGGPGLNNTSLIGAWAPGSLPFVPPPDVAMRVTAGSRIVLNVHYHPTGVEERDSGTSLDLRRFPGVLPKYVGILALIGNSNGSGEGLLPGPNDPNGSPVFRIPAGATDHTEEMLISPGNDIPELRVFGATSHMHYVGTDMLIGIQRNTPVPGSPDQECLLQTPRWDFQWQRLYNYEASLDEVPRVHGGDSLYLRCRYNNSMSNPFVAKALAEQGLTEPKDVVLGEATLDEMCLGVFGVAVALEDLI